VNALAADDEAAAPAAYGCNLARLRKIKHKWDPGNIFRSNHNIQPA
jgi:FAD/FMN-containing dehydrogenase